MDKPKLNFRFHNPNTPEELTNILLRVCIDANMKKVELIMREEAAVALDNSIGDKNEYSGILQSIDGREDQLNSLEAQIKFFGNIHSARRIPSCAYMPIRGFRERRLKNSNCKKFWFQ